MRLWYIITALVLAGGWRTHALQLTELKGEPTKADGPILKFKHGVPIAFGDSQPLCFPRRQWTLRARIDLHQLYAASEKWTTAIKDQIRSYNTTGDAGILATNYCTVSQRDEGGKCLTTSLTQLSAADQKFIAAREELALATLALENRVSHISRRLLRAPLTFRASFPPIAGTANEFFPFLNTTIRRYQNEKFFEVNPTERIVYLEVLDLLIENNWIRYFRNADLLGSDGKYKQFESAEKKSDFVLTHWKKTTAVLRNMLSILNSVEFAVEQMSRNLFPTDLFPANILSEIVMAIPSKETGTVTSEQQDLLFITTMPLTHYVISEKAGDGTCTGDACLFDLVTFYPIIAQGDLYQFVNIFTVPIAKDTYLGAVKWQELELSSQLLLIKDENQYFSIPSKESLLCLTDMFNATCDICSVTGPIFDIDDECLLEVLEERTPNRCNYLDIREPKRRVQKVDQDKWIFVDPSPGQVVEDCKNNMSLRSFELPYAGILRFQKTCSYSMIGTPFQPLVPYVWGSEVISSNPRKLNPNTKQIAEDISTVQLHFRRYGYIYLISFGGILLLVIFAACWVCCIRIRYIMHRRRRLRERRNRIRFNEQTSLISAPAESLSRAFPTLPLRDVLALTAGTRENV